MKLFRYALILVALTIDGKSNDLIRSMKVEKNKLIVTPNKELKKSFLKEDFFVEYDDDINLETMDGSILIIPFVAQIFSTVWVSGKDYYVDSMDENFYEALQKIKQVFKVLYPKTRWDGEIIPRKIVSTTMPNLRDPQSEVALLFSGGLDSTCSSYYLADKKQLLVTCWGQGDVPLHDKKLWDARSSQLREFGEEHGHENTFIKSNYVSFFDYGVLKYLSPEIGFWRIGAIEGVGLFGLAAPVLYAKGYQAMYIASSNCWDLEYPDAAIPYVDNNLCFGSTRLQHHLFSMSRLQKIEWLSAELKRLNKDKQLIKGCHTRNKVNCCKCSRCLQTLGMIYLVGEQGSTFNYDIPRNIALKRLQKLASDDDLDFEDMYNFICMTDYLHQLEKRGETVPEDFRWLFDFSYDLSEAPDVDDQQKINWDLLHSLFPDIRDTCGEKSQELRTQYESGQREQGIPYTIYALKS